MDDLFSYRGVVVALHVLTAVAAAVSAVAQFCADRQPRRDFGPSGDYRERIWTIVRWSALVSMVGAWGLVTMRNAHGTPVRVPSMTLLLVSVLALSVHWFHIWFVAWPAMRTGGTRALASGRAALRVNTTTAIPAWILLVCAELAPGLGGGGRWIPHWFWLANFAIYGLLVCATVLTPRLVISLLGVRPVSLVLGLATLGTLALM